MAAEPNGFKTGLRSGSDNRLTKFGYRWQSSVAGGWLERDTLDAALSPTNANRYAFAGADPINLIDPTGRSATSDGLATSAGAATGVLALGVFTGAVAGACIVTACLAVGIGLSAVAAGWIADETTSTLTGGDFDPASSVLDSVVGTFLP